MWTYDSYLDLIEYGIREGCDFFLRHDVDISLKKALPMAEVEASRKLHATYYILMSSPFYNALDPDNLERIRMLRHLGMGIGLHYDLSIKGPSVDGALKEIIVQIGLLTHHIGELNGASVTFHKPALGVPGNLELTLRLNQNDIYCPDSETKYKYISDSGHNWRENPRDVMDSHKVIHMNTHPIWYNDEEQDMESCLHSIALEQDTDRLIYREINSIREYLTKI